MRKIFLREKWVSINYKDIKPNMYMISNFGKVKNIISNHIVHYNNPDNEKGYRRVPLITIDGKTKKLYKNISDKYFTQPITTVKSSTTIPYGSTLEA